MDQKLPQQFPHTRYDPDKMRILELFVSFGAPKNAIVSHLEGLTILRGRAERVFCSARGIVCGDAFRHLALFSVLFTHNFSHP